MADVSLGPPDGKRLREADRGQLLVVAGLVMAVSLVALVVLLNATIFTENLATRGIQAADGEAADVRTTAVGGVGELIDATNREERESHEVTNVTDGVADLDERMARNYAGRGGVVHLETNESRVTEGWYLSTAGNATSLANDTNATAYAFVDGIDRTRGFSLSLSVDDDDLANTTPSNATGEAFHVVFDGPALSESREVYVYRNGSGDVAVANGSAGGDPEVRCSIAAESGENVTFDLTGERLGETACPGVWPVELFAPSDPYAIRFENADAADGTATATVRPRPAGSEPGADHDGISPAVYDATVDLRYRTADLRFETTVRVAPGEPRA
ncbi:DUF7261 family protein [Halorubrum cibi]|uniref:Uncharacterized protein n=1 Tax=Halorubrum cibi TaxID=413815 RepID=A0A521ECQ0_9EURY|nr:hypothetical protein [Halorubrum cibi]SMO81693.1 hypothetical protein SAMN06264867_11051 [Halorubrum cibi]